MATIFEFVLGKKNKKNCRKQVGVVHFRNLVIQSPSRPHVFTTHTFS